MAYFERKPYWPNRYWRRWPRSPPHLSMTLRVVLCFKLGPVFMKKSLDHLLVGPWSRSPQPMNVGWVWGQAAGCLAAPHPGHLPHFLSPHSCQSLCHKRMQSPHLGDFFKMEVLDGWNSAISKRYLEQLPHRSSPKDPSCCRIKTFIGTVTFWSDVLDQVDAVTKSWNAMKLEVWCLLSWASLLWFNCNQIHNQGG